MYEVFDTHKTTFEHFRRVIFDNGNRNIILGANFLDFPVAIPSTKAL